jgi:putative ABC transport system permease protein
MTARVPIARRQLLADRRRSALAIAGVGLALLLALTLQGIFAGATRQVTRYIRTNPADVIVSQAGVRTMHMSSSALDAGVADQVRILDGVAWAEPIRYSSAVLTVEDASLLAYVIGAHRSDHGGATDLVAGRQPGRDQAVVDRVAADSLGIEIGDTITLTGRDVEIVGLTRGLTSVANTTVFVDWTWFDGAPPAYLLVKARSGTTPQALAETVRAALGPNVEVQTRNQFASSEAAVVADMSSDILRIMSGVAFAIAVAVIALATYTATVARLRDVAVLKALGAPTRRLAAVTVTQSAWTVAVAVAVAVMGTAALGWIIPNLNPAVDIALTPNAVRNAVAAGVGAALIGAVTPLLRVAAVDPSTAFGRAT